MELRNSIWEPDMYWETTRDRLYQEGEVVV